MSSPSSQASPAAPDGASPEQYAALPNGLDLCYQTFGDPTGEPLLLVMGLGGPMTWWSPAFCRALADRGFFVIRYDNRDTGRSSRAPGRVTRRMLGQSFVGPPRTRPRPPYTLEDLAEDGFGLLDHLGLESAHVVGISMGGMISQSLAIRHPGRVASLTSIMSNTSDRKHGKIKRSLLRKLPKLLVRTPDDAVDNGVEMFRLISGPHFDAAVHCVLRGAHQQLG